MKKIISAFFAFSAVAAFAQTPLTYPEAQKLSTEYDYAGTKVADPYSWLENVDSPETQQWVQAEDKLTFDYLHAIPSRERIIDRLKKLWNYERFQAPQLEGGRYFYDRNNGLQNQAVLYVADSLNGESRVLLDPNTLSTDGTIALSGTSISQDGKLLAYSLSSGGSDWQEWHVRNVDTGQDLPDVIKWSKFSDASWTKDASGFFYSRFDEPKGNALKDADYDQKIYFHKLGTDQSEDALIYSRHDHPDWGLGGDVTEDGQYLVIVASMGTAHENRVYFKKMSGGDVQDLFVNADANYTFLGSDDATFYFTDDKGAPKGQVVSVDTANGNGVKVIIPESSDMLEGASIVGGKIFCRYLKDAHSDVRVYDMKGHQVSDVKLPGIGSAAGFGGHMTDKETFYSYASYTSPTTIYRYDVASGKSSVFRKPKIDFDASKYETKEVFVPSKDGGNVPIFITYRKGIKLNGQNPTLMYGYGGFDINETPYFGISRAVWLEMGGVYADVVLHGGAEYGEAWHQAGMLHHKQRVFNDFITAGEYLISSGYTSTPKLAIQGGSNGGLLIGAMITQRPDLWGAALPEVGVMDMLRFNKFTIGYAWMSEYGNPDKAEDFPYIVKYSPLHNIKAGVRYPPTLITTGDHDDRVFPAHSFKFAATMQADQAGDAPVLIRIEVRAGHGAGKPISKTIEEIGDEWGFLVKNLNMTLPAGF
ncbi:MAG TPA: prolyl oligopeptidase family serine peptidase [Fimbriimonadaceae bacterium]|jgi:prolyl oligopeptidase